MNKIIPRTLIDALEKDELIIFVGSGLSTNNGLPDWTKIVQNLLNDNKERIEKAAAYLNALDADIMKPLEILDKLKSEKKYILESFEKSLYLKNKDSKIHKTLSTITNKFITTNFDSLIEHNSSIETIITQDSEYNLSKIDTSDEYILKIHGDEKRLDKCIIFTEQYEDLYNEDKLAAFQLKKIFSSSSILFIGFSFNDPYVESLFDYINTLADGFGQKHFLVSASKKDLKHTVNINIGDYSKLEEFLYELSDIKQTLLKEKVVEEEEEIQVPKAVDVEDFDILIEEDGSDVAPTVLGWVGRKDELDLLHNGIYKVCFITGFGGEGKSALASYYLTQINDEYTTDWRDFKEEDHKFYHKIQSMIKLVCPGISTDQLNGYTDEELVRIFFKKLGSQKFIFVLDNVDSYIDLESCEATKGIGYLLNEAMKHKHNSKFIFTCRPFIHEARVHFLQIRLEGLHQEETIEYFLKGNTNIKKDALESYAIKAHTLTKGHALWLSLILAQSRKGEKSLKEFLEKLETGTDIENDTSSIMSKQILSSIWDNLHDREKTVLRSLGESIASESIDSFAEILKQELNHNKFQKAINALRNLNLIIEKRNTDFIELHPLVKEYIRTNYPNSERNRYIALFVDYYDKSVIVLKRKLSHKLSYSDFTNFTNKAELSTNAGNYQESINTLWEVINSMTAAGFTEEFLRVAKHLFNKIGWNKRIINELTYFDELLNLVIRYFLEYGDEESSSKLLKEYEKLIENKDEKYIKLCTTISYLHWFKNDYKSSIDVADEAIYLINKTGVGDVFDLKQTQALSYRDSLETENIEKALNIFLNDVSLDSLLDNTIIKENVHGTMYGNIGRCLYFLNKNDDALNCYMNSFYYIAKLDIEQRLINLGYASFWIAEVYFNLKDKEKACYFLKLALNFWEKCSPVLVERNKKVFKSLDENTTSKNINSLEDWRVEEYCFNTISELLIKKILKYKR